ncbi:efflux RND transporter periplasmic adaptor subunit [Bacteroides caecicola]|uniref:efflux RND transporter periplasmic adaptor subunit n=1 Tax=Bacteroides caecicola TaxID=1462569 RepID=UPI0015B66055|nr:efflux RND transporter periplasmic adaptor subunit [Bacteroides caecicola]MCL1624990.1 efflux RND transporter periplasmic adaptor subunit [Bacteroides caecicola]
MKKYLFMGTALLFLCGACTQQHNHEAEEAAHEAESHGGHSDEIILTPEKAKAAGVMVETVTPGTFREVIPTSGQVLAAQGDENTLVAATAGVVSFSRTVTEGMSVGRDVELLSVSAENLQDGDPVKRARIAYERAKGEYERAEKLIGERIVSEKEFNVLKENYENARIAYEALSPSKAGKGVAVKSPMAGYVKACFVKEGDYVTVGQPLLSVTQTRRLMLRAEVSERYYSRLHNIASANFQTPYDDKVYSLTDLKGRLLSFGKSSDGTSYYVPVTFEFDNRGDVIPGSFVEVYLLASERQNVLSVPVSALTEEQGLYFIYCQIDEECYRKQEVTVGANDGKRVEILSGLKGGEKVVTQGAIHVKLASASTAIPGHTHNH